MSYQSGYRENRRGKGNGEYMSSYQKRQAWTPEEDEILKQQVARLGTHCWPDVASGLVGRTSKACSLRWRCFLSPTIIRPNEEPFSQWEIAVIVLTQKMFGNKWNDIANYLPMRCNNDIKNHFNLYLKDKQQQVSLENSYLRAGYDLPTLLANEPEEVQQRREKLEKERANSNNFDHAPVKSSSRGMSSYLRRAAAAPAKPKPATVKYHPYHIGANAAVLAAAAQPGSAMTGVTRSGSGPSLVVDCDSASPTSQHQTFAAFAALPRPHSAQSMGAMDTLTLGAGLRAVSMAAAAGLPSSLLYGGMEAPYTATGAVLGQGMMQEQLLQHANNISSISNIGGVKQEQQLGDNSMGAAAAAGVVTAGTYTSYAASNGYGMVPGGVSSSAAEWQVNGSSQAMHLAGVGVGAAGGCEEGGPVQRLPSRLAQVGHPELSDIMGHGASLTFAGQQHGVQQQGYATDIKVQCMSMQSVGLTAFDKLPSLPDPTTEPCMLDGCGDGDGTSLRGIFSSDDGEHGPFAAQRQSLPGTAAAATQGQLQQQGSGSHMQAAPQLGGIDLAAAAAAAAQQHSPPTSQQLAAPGTAYASPGSFTSGCSPIPHFQRPMQQQQQPAAAAPAAGSAGHLKHGKLQLDIECAVRAAAYDNHVVAGGDRGALSAPCTVTAAYTPNGCHQRGMPQGAFTQAGRDVTQLGFIQQQQQQQQQQHTLPHMQSQQQRQVPHLLQGRYTPFGHPVNQQQHMNHICQDQHSTAQQCHPAVQAAAAAAYQPGSAGCVSVAAYDSGNSSHHHQQPAQDMSSPTTVAGSAAAAVARGCALATAGAHSWGSSPTSVAAAATALQQQKQQQADPHHLLTHAVSDDLGQGLVDLLDSADGDTDHCGAAVHAGLVEGTDCELLLSDDLDHAEFAHSLPGLDRQNTETELEMIAAAACW